MKRFIFLFILQGIYATQAEEKLEIRPSVWGTQSWVGGYDIYSGDKKAGSIRASVWGTEKWPGGYDLYREGRKVGEAKASVWGQESWNGGYEIKVNSERDGKILKSILK